MTTNLTNPQRDLLLRTMRNEGRIDVAAAQWRVAHNLVAKGCFEYEGYETFSVTVDGLKSLLRHRMIEDANKGSMASMANVEEVRAALAAAGAA